MADLEAARSELDAANTRASVAELEARNAQAAAAAEEQKGAALTSQLKEAQSRWDTAPDPDSRTPGLNAYVPACARQASLSQPAQDSFCTFATQGGRHQSTNARPDF